MTIEAENGLNGNYIVIRDENIDTVGDELCMLINNTIPGFISVEPRTVDDSYCLYFDVSSMISLRDISKRQEFTYKEIKEIIYSLIKIKKSTEEYLLTDSGVIMSPEYVFYDTKEHAVKYCVYPYHGKELNDSLNELSEFILQHTDHSDKRSVRIIYELYSMIQNGDFNFERLLSNNDNIRRRVPDHPDSEINKHKKDCNNSSNETIHKTADKTASRVNLSSIFCMLAAVCIVAVLLIVTMIDVSVIKFIVSDNILLSSVAITLSIMIYVPVSDFTKRHKEKLGQGMNPKT